MVQTESFDKKKCFVIKLTKVLQIEIKTEQNLANINIRTKKIVV